jgi:hypothetical protein
VGQVVPDGPRVHNTAILDRDVMHESKRKKQTLRSRRIDPVCMSHLAF